jgi:hypothetical protein
MLLLTGLLLLFAPKTPELPKLQCACQSAGRADWGKRLAWRAIAGQLDRCGTALVHGSNSE